MSVKADTTGLEYQSAEWFEACAAIKRGQLAGKAVEYFERGNNEDKWSFNASPQWHEGFDYRLAPEPREVWVRFGEFGGPVDVDACERSGYLKFREVIE